MVPAEVDMTFQDVGSSFVFLSLVLMNAIFGPSEIRIRFLTAEDDLIRYQDTPMRLQRAASSLTQSSGWNPELGWTKGKHRCQERPGVVHPGN